MGAAFLALAGLAISPAAAAATARCTRRHQLGVRQCGGGLRARPRRLAHGARDGSRTGGNGTGAGLGSQGALILDGTGLAVNAGSNCSRCCTSTAAARCGWQMSTYPGARGRISVTVHGRFVYVLNAGDASTPANIRGFLALWGKLVPLPGSTRPARLQRPDPARWSSSAPTAATLS